MSYRVAFSAGMHIQKAAQSVVRVGQYADAVLRMSRRQRRSWERTVAHRRRRGNRTPWTRNALSGRIWGRFNDIDLVYRAGVSPDDLVAEYHLAFEASAKAYRESPEGQRRAREEEERVATMQALADHMIGAMPAILAVDDLQMTIEWLCNLQKATDHIGVRIDRDAVIQAFRLAGFEPDVFCGEAFEQTREIFARWLIGQALDGIHKMGTPHPIIHKFADQWRAQWGARLPAVSVPQ